MKSISDDISYELGTNGILRARPAAAWYLPGQVPGNTRSNNSRGKAMIAKRLKNDKADVYTIDVRFYDNGMVMFDYPGAPRKEVLSGTGTNRQDAEKLIRAKLHSFAETFTLAPQS
jgi:hypothetical protein